MCPIQKEKMLKFYIYKYAAGFSDTAYKRKTYVIRPNGQVLSTHRSMFGPNYPKVEKGAVIVVPSKPEKVKRKRNGISADTGQKLQKVFTGTIGAISSVLTLYLLYLTVKNTSK
jgi:hypothetical protein